MYRILFFAITLVCFLVACGGPSENVDPPSESVAAHGNEGMPDDAVHSGMGGAESDGGSHSMGLNTAIELAPEIAAAWSAIGVRVLDRQAETSNTFEISLGSTVALGDSGLTLTAVVFVPDFVMGDGGITSRSAEAANPAAQVIIREAEQADFEGWLFANMPDIHPYPHERYQVLLEGGVPTK